MMVNLLRFCYVEFMARLDAQLSKFRYRRNPASYVRSRQWLSIGEAKPAEQVYNEVQRFVKDVVGLAPRPYGHGAYSLVMGAMWPPEDNPRTDRWQINFTWQGRVEAYRQMAERIAGWPEPPLAIQVSILPYSTLMAVRPAPRKEN